MKKLLTISLFIVLVALAVGTVVVAADKDKPGLTHQEYKELVKIYDYEIKKLGSISLKNVNSDNVYDKLEAEIDKRKIKEDKVNYDKADLTKEEYRAKKDDLFAKRKNSKLTK